MRCVCLARGGVVVFVIGPYTKAANAAASV